MLFLGVFKNYLQPSIEILNLRIDEPITTVTDVLLAAICFYAFYRIRQFETIGRIKRYFKYYFLTLGLGALCGGIFGHAFLYRLSPEWKLVSWIFTLISVALIVHALLEVAKPFVKPGVSRLIIRINLLILAIALFFAMWTQAFSPVKYYTIFGMVAVVGSLSFFIFQKTSSRGVVIVMAAVGFGIVSALIFSFELGLGPWFNHQDISHLILSFSAYNMYKGASLILDTNVAMV